jgi:hypothetical protein
LQKKNSYNQLSTDYSLLGKWTIRNTNISGSWEYEIYYKGSKFIGVKSDGIYKKEILEKSGNKFTVKGDRHGEYYIISANKEMTLFHKDGELASMGYITTKSK